ncbi:MAG TPA: hypothetical protein VIR16_07950 [Candidatus Limnocylindrales bacterium]
MTTDRRLLGAALSLSLVLAACGGSSASPAATSATSGATTAPGTASSAPAASTGSASQSQDANAPDISLTPGNASALEALIPDKIGSATITKTSFDYSSIPWASLSGTFGSGDLEKVLKDNGKSLADVKFAMGVATSAGATMPTMVYALQVSGLDASKFVSQLDSNYASGSDLQIGGKTVKGQVAGGLGTITYAHGDVVFIAIATEADLNSLVSALP